jgi:hypothetical protein
MKDASPLKPKEPCARKAAIKEDLQAAMAKLMAIHNAEIEAVLVENFDELEKFPTEIRIARERKARLVEQYREHVISHGC